MYIFEPQFLIVTQGGAVVKKFIAVAAAIAAFGFVNTASAADMPTKAPAYRAAPVAMYNWTGFYVGGNVGYGWASNTGAGFTSFTDTAPLFGAVGYFAGGGNVLPGVKPRGAIGGAQIGYNWQTSPMWVLGLVADLQASGMKDSAIGSVTPVGFVNTTQSNESKITWFGTARAKAGFASNNWLIYGTGGLIYGGVKTATALNCPACGPPQFFAGSTSSTKAGWTIGAGLDYGLTPNWILGAEYLYFDLGSISTTATLTSGTNVNTTFTSNSKFRGSIARVSLDYKFN